MRSIHVVLYFALNSIVLLIGVVLLLCGDRTMSGSFIAAGISAYIIFASIHIQLKDTKKHDELVHALELFGITDIREQRLLREEYAAARKRTRKNLDIMGFGLRHFVEDCGSQFADWSKSFEIRMLVVDPDTPYCDQRDYEEDDPIGKVRQDVKSSTSVVVGMRNPRIRMRWYRAIPITNMLRMDDVMWVGPYFTGKKSRNGYVLKLVQGGVLFDEYLAHFERIWGDNNLSREPA